MAQDIEAQGGEAWVLPVIGLSEAEERIVRDRMLAERDEEYLGLEEDALAFIARRSAAPAPADAFAARLQIDKELLALQRRFRKIRARDYVDAPARAAAAQAIDRCLAFRQGISPKVRPMTDAEVAAHEEDDV